MKRALFFIILLMSRNAFCLDYDFGGHIRAFSSSSFYGKDHLINSLKDDDPYFDQSLNTRLKLYSAVTDRLSFNIHFESYVSGGDTKDSVKDLDPYSRFLFEKSNKDNRLFDLSSSNKTEHFDYTNGLDRFNLKYEGDYYSLSLGRLAHSTGNGLIFNPMDILNPFAPSDFVRDYKKGTDMALFQFSKGLKYDISMAAVPRRNSLDNIDSKESSYALKLKSYIGDYETGLFLARHYNENITGTSFSGFAGSAAWRADILWTDVKSDENENYFSGIINIDYSWVMNGKNWYALLEFFYSGIGEKDYEDALQNKDLVKKVERGELYNTATRYAGIKIQNEIHPLVNIYLTSILNIDDRSLMIQPVAKWNASENTDILFGADIYSGSGNTEFKGVTDLVSGRKIGPAGKFYIQISLYF